MALQLLTSCFGSYSAGIIVWACQAITSGPGGTGGWLPQNINDGRLDLYFLLLAGIMAINTLFYLVVAYNYEYKEVEHEYTIKRQQAADSPVQEAQGEYGGPTQSITIQRQQRGSRVAKDGPYGRSITYVPDSPNLPPQLR